MPRAKIEKDRIIIQEVTLNLKETLKQVLPADELVYVGKARDIAFPLRYGHLSYDILKRFGCDLSTDLESQLDIAKERYHNHLTAREEVFRIQEELKALTGSTHWDGILKWYQGIEVNSMTIDGLLGMCLFDEQGAGKTLSGIAAFDILRGAEKVRTLIAVCPKSVIGNWKRDFVKFLGDKYKISVLAGTTESKFRQLQDLSDVYLVNFESVAPLLAPFISIAKDTKVMLVVDESYLVKNPEALRSTAVRRLRSFCEKAYVLCGTPAPNNPDDIIHQFDVADDGFTFFGFKPTYMNTRDRPEIIKRIDQRGVFIRNLKKDVLPDLPKKQFYIHRVEMAEKQKALYERAKSELVLYLRNLDNTTFRKSLVTYFQKRAALLQICVSPKMVDITYDETPAKYTKLDELVRSIVQDSERKVVIWSYYTRSLNELTSRYGKYGVVRVDGTVESAMHRSELVDGFQTDPNLKVFVGNPAAAGAGINLYAASECVYVSFSNQAAHYLQSLDRIHRIGQEASKVQYHFLICRDSIEETEAQRLGIKEKSQKDLLGDPLTEEPTLEAALAELGG